MNLTDKHHDSLHRITKDTVDVQLVCDRYCPWKDMDHDILSLCEGLYCNEAVTAYLEAIVERIER